MTLSNSTEKVYAYIHSPATEHFHYPGIEQWIFDELANRDYEYLLDLGCGYGIWGYYVRTILRNNNSYLVGLDISQEKIRTLKNLGIYNELVVGDARHLPFREGIFSAVIAVEVLQGIWSRELVSSLVSLGKKGGVIIITLPEVPGGFSIRDDLKGFRVLYYRFGISFRIGLGLVVIEVGGIHRILTAWHTRSLYWLGVLSKISTSITRRTPYLILIKEIEK